MPTVGHTKVRCQEPLKADDGGFGNGSGGAGDFDAPAAGGIDLDDAATAGGGDNWGPVSGASGKDNWAATPAVVTTGAGGW